MKCYWCEVEEEDFNLRPYQIGLGQSCKVLFFHSRCFDEWFNEMSKSDMSRVTL